METILKAPQSTHPVAYPSSFPMPSRSTRRLFSRASLLAAAALLGAPSHGATLTWNAGLPGDWNTANTNWSGSTWNNATPDDAVFNNLDGTITFTEAITAGSVSFNWNGNSGTTRSPVLTGGTLTVTGGITVDGYGLGGSGVDSVEQAYNVRAQISNTTNVTGNVTVRRGMLYLSGATLNVGGAISSWDAWSVFRSDNSTVTATGGIDFSAIASAVDLQGGTVTTPFIKVGNHTPANSGLFMAGGVRIIATGNSADFIQVYNSGNTGSRAAATLNAGGVNLDTSTYAITISTVLNGAGGLTKSGNGTLTLSGANTYAGGTTVSAGTLIIASQANAGGSSSLGNSAPSNLVTIGNGGTLTGNIWNWLDNTGLTAGGTNAHAVQVDAGGTLKGASGYITGLGNITLNGGTIEVSNGFVNGAWNGAFTLGGDITVTGTTASAITTSAGAGASANLQMSNGANSVGGTRTFRVNDVTASAASDLVVSARLADGTIVKEGAGTLELTSAPGTGTPVNWTVNAGALKLDLGARSGNASIGEFSVAGQAALNLDNTNTTVGDYFPQGFVLSGSGTVTKNGVGSIDFWTGSNLTGFTGTMDIQQGSLRLNNIGANGNMGQATLNIASGATFDVRHASSLSVDKLTGSGTLDQSYNSGSGLSVTVGANNGSGAFGGVIQNSSGQPLSLTKSGNGTLTLSGANSYGGKTFITGGTIIAASNTALGVGGHNGTTMAEISDGATLALQGGISLDEHFHVWGAGVGGFGAVRSLSGNNALTNAPGGAAGFCLRSNTTVGVDADTLTVSGFYESDGSFSLTKVGSGTLVLTVSNTYTGGTTVNGGTLALGGSRGVLQGAVTINTSGTVSMAAGNMNRYWDVASTRINAGGLLTMDGHSHLRNLTLAGGELGGSGGEPTYGTWYFDDATTVTGGVVSTLSAQNIYLANGNLSIEAGSTLNFTGSVKGGSFIPTIAAGGKLTNGAAANTSLSLGALVLNGGELAATSAPAGNLGNYQLRGDVTVGGSSMSTISADVRVVNNETRVFDVADVDGGSGVDLLISGKLGHHNGAAWGYATKAGAGTMKLSGVNEIGGLTVSAGLLILENTAISGFGATGLTNNASAELRVDAGTSTPGYVISGSGALTKSGNGTLALTASNTYAGTTTISAGTLKIGNGGANGSLYSPSVSNGNLTFGSAGAIVNNGALAYEIAGGDVRVNKTISGAGTLSVTGDRSVHFADGTAITTTGAQTYSATATGGRYYGFNLAENASVALTSSGAISMTGMLGTSNSNTSNLTLDTSAGNGNVTLNTPVGVSGVDYGMNSLTVRAGTGAVSLGTFNGKDWGTVNTISLTGGDVNSTATMYDFTTLTVTNTGTGTFSGRLTAGSGSLTKSGNGTLTLSGNNSFGGGITLNGGILRATRNTLGTGAVVVNSGATLQANDQWVFCGANGYGEAQRNIASLTLNAGGTLHLDATQGFANGISNFYLNGGAVTGGANDDTRGALYLYGGNEQITAGGNATSTIGVSIGLNGNNNSITVESGSRLEMTNVLKRGAFDAAGRGGFVKSGAGTLVLSGANSYDGVTDITAGTLIAASNTAIGAGGHAGETQSWIRDGATLALQGGISLDEHFHVWGAGVGGLGAVRSLSGNNTLSNAPGGNAGFCLRSNTTVGVDADTLTVSGFYEDGGSFGLTKVGNGTLVLNVLNSYTGGTTVNAGTLSLLGSGGNGRIRGALTVNAGATVVTTGDGTGLGYNNQLSSLTINGGLVKAEGSDNHVWNIAGGVTMNGGELQTNGGTSSGSGRTFQWNRTSLTTNASANSAVISGRINLRDDAGYSSWDVNVADGAADTDLLVSAAITGGGVALTKSGNGKMTLTGGISYTGATAINAGILVLDALGGTYDYNGGNISINGGSTLRVSGLAYTFNGKTVAFGAAGGGTLDAIATGGGGMYQTGGNTITTSGGAQNTLSGTKLPGGNQGINLNSQTLTFDVAVGADPAVPNLNVTGTLWNSGNLTKSGNGILLLSGNSEYSGATTINAGTLIFRGASASSSHGISTGAALEFDVASGSRNLNTANFTGAGTLRKTGAGGIIWGSGTATFALDSGALIDVQAGLFTGGSYGNDVWTNNKSDLNVASGATFNTVEANVRVNKITGTGTIKTGYGGAGYANLTIGVDNGESTFAGVIENADATGNLVKIGIGAITLSGTNTYSGSTTVSDGTLKVTTLGTTGGSSVGSSDRSNAANLLLNGPVTLEYAGAGESTSRSFTVSGSGLTLSSTGAGAVNFTADSSIAFAADGNSNRELKLNGSNTGENTFGSSLSGTPADADKINKITKDGVGTWILSGPANRFRNALSIDVNAGTLGLAQGSVDLSGDGALIALNAGATLRWEAGNTADLASRLYLLPAGQNTEATVEIVAGTVSFADSLASGSNLALVKAGAGTLELNTDQPEIAGVRVNSGKLTAKADGALGAGAATVAGGTLSIAQGVSVNNVINVSTGGTLSGKGTTGAVTVAPGGIISPGSSPGMLTHASLALTGGSIINWEVYDATGAAGVGYDRLVVTGNLDLSGASSSSRIVLKIKSLSTLDTAGDPLNFGAPNGVGSIRTFQFGQAGGLLLGNGAQNISDVFAFDVDDFTYSDGSSSNAGLWSISWNAGTGAITLTAVPEPSTYGLGLGALALAAAALRRRRRQDAKA